MNTETTYHPGLINLDVILLRWDDVRWIDLDDYWEDENATVTMQYTEETTNGWLWWKKTTTIPASTTITQPTKVPMATIHFIDGTERVFYGASVEILKQAIIRERAFDLTSPTQQP